MSTIVLEKNRVFALPAFSLVSLKRAATAVLAMALGFTIPWIATSTILQTENVATFHVNAQTQQIAGADATAEALAISERFALDAQSVPGVTFATVASAEGMQGLFRLDSAEAPTLFRFEGAIPAEHSASVLADGSVAIIDATGVAVSAIAAPWAYDANGVAVPTSFAITEGTLTQTVNHSGAAYPVTADPCWRGWSCAKKVGTGAVVGAAIGAAGGCVATLAIGCGAGAATGARGGAVGGAGWAWWNA